MEKSSGSFECALFSWGIAALVAVVAFAMLMLLGGWTFMQAAFVGAIVLVVGGVGLTWAFCSPLPGPNEVTLPGQAAAEPVAEPVAATPTPAAATPPAPEPEPAAAEPAPAEPAPAAPAAEPVSASGTPAKPQLLAAPQGAADDLKRIKGVGPKLEEKLNTMGVWHFSQIAGWTPEQVGWVDDSLNFKGRIDRDDWIGQAKVLAAGGTTEFSERSGKK